MMHPSSDRQVILIDASRLRREELGSYHASCRALDREARKLKAFEDTELPAFLAWVQSEFATELGQLNESTAVVRELEVLLADVERYIAWKGVSRRVALDVLEAAHLDGTYHDLWQAFEEDAEDADDPDDAYNLFERLWEQAAEDERAGASSERGSSRPKISASAEDKPADDYMKSLYRKIVRVLHPDVNDGLSREKQELWQAVQDAYTWRDVHRLEQLYAQIVKSGDDVVNLKTAPIGDVQSLRRAVELNLKRLRSKIRESQRHAAWGFRKTKASAGKLKKLRREIGNDLAHDVMMMRLRRDELEQIVERWQRPTTAKSRAKERRSR